MTNFRRVSAIALAIFAVVSLNLVCSAQAGWRAKTYQEWTREDAESLLSNSPWVQTLQKGSMGVSLPFPNTGARSMGAVTLQLRSALPVRQAIVRLRQLKAKYDRMDATGKATFDSQMKPVLECPGCKRNYVMTLTPSPVMLTRLSLDAVKEYIQLKNERGESRKLVHIDIPKEQGGEAILFFARFDEKGEPLLASSNKKLIVLFDPEIFRHDAVGNPRFEFDVSKLIMDGEVAF